MDGAQDRAPSRGRGLAGPCPPGFVPPEETRASPAPPARRRAVHPVEKKIIKLYVQAGNIVAEGRNTVIPGAGRADRCPRLPGPG